MFETKVLLIPVSFVLLLVCSCTNTRKNRQSDFFVNKEDYGKAYKTAVMCGCLHEGTKGGFYKFLKDNNDLGLFTEGDLISHYTVNEADSFGRIYARKIKPFTYGDGQGKVPIFSRCFHYAMSNQVDSIVQQRTKEQRYNDMITNGDDYIKAYKAVVLYGCMNGGTNGNFYKFLQQNNDLHLFSEVDMIFHSTAHEADSIGRIYAQKIKPFTYGDGQGKVPNFSQCFYYAMSIEVDSAARENYRQMLKRG